MSETQAIDVARYDLIDYPTAWAICSTLTKHRDPRCSNVQSKGFLCDCGAVNVEWARLRREVGLSTHGGFDGPCPCSTCAEQAS